MKILKPVITNADIDAGELSITIDETKLGDLISTVTKGLGIKECSSCQERKEILNRIREAGLLETVKQLSQTL